MHGFRKDHKVDIRSEITILSQKHPIVANRFLMLINQGGAMNGFTENHKIMAVKAIAKAPVEISLSLLISFDYKGVLHTQTEEKKVFLLQSIENVTISEALKSCLTQYPDTYSSVLFYLFSSQFKLDYCLPLEERVKQLPRLLKNMLDPIRLISVLLRNPRVIAENMWQDITKLPLYNSHLIGLCETGRPPAFD